MAEHGFDPAENGQLLRKVFVASEKLSIGFENMARRLDISERKIEYIEEKAANQETEVKVMQEKFNNILRSIDVLEKRDNSADESRRNRAQINRQWIITCVGWALAALAIYFK